MTTTKRFLEEKEDKSSYRETTTKRVFCLKKKRKKSLYSRSLDHHYRYFKKERKNIPKVLVL